MSARVKEREEASSPRAVKHARAHVSTLTNREREFKRERRRERDQKTNANKMSSEKGLVITPTEQLPFKCASSVILFFSAEIFSLDTFLLSKGGWGEIFYFFPSLLSSRRVLSLSLDVENRESYGELRRDAHARRGRRHLSSFSSFPPPLRLLRKRES